MKEILYDYFTNIDISGHKGQAIRKGVKFGPRRPIEDYLNGNIKISSLKLKIRLIKDGFPLDFDKDFMKYRGIELRGKTAGVVGLGHNGEAIAERMKGLGLNVVYWSKNTRNDNYTYSELEDIFANADVIVPAFAHNEETDAIISDELLGKMKPSAIVVDIIELKNKDKLIEMVKAGKLFGYGFEAEPKTFAEYEGNIWSAPAYAWVTDGSMNNSMTKLVENMVNAVNGNFPNRVNQ